MPYCDEEPCKEEIQNTGIKPLVTFGILTDVQYVDVEDGMSYDKTRHRYYRNSLKLVKEAILNWKKHEIENECKFKFLIQLGDLIDLKAKEKGESDKSLNLVIIKIVIFRKYITLDNIVIFKGDNRVRETISSR